ncbi:metallophosphoesterase [Candidatus Methanomassiliicoccus intestinalis]|jgi:hypothetical protein BBPR_0308|uniref:Calcineurin-like phosphoesterase domain-containing protein n=2 Tax=Candidatus Methanomassiliicoccus intestinalis TaxID=1406512 RepID=R9T6Q3_METII|nr:metallophosphoesterase [Candidatus Methanomassiliicoccus intestinalis]AGN26274.1 hypothetical protein MMINT_09150 [Candidatus Methanomassiliicoccus intestinalis Issoire-Mx1]TQS84655.1 MAG: hypothetical protein A3207_01030 [Candidatus Methanomassiliicoccus intestinalis]
MDKSKGVNKLAEKLGIADEEDPFIAFNKNPCASTLSRIGKNLQTFEMVQRAVENDDGCGTILKFMSKQLMTEDLCIIACSKNGDNLDYVPEYLLSYNICKAALSNRGELLSKIPEKFKTYELCEIAVSTDEKYVALSYVPLNLIMGEQGRRLCELAIKKNPLAIEKVPNEFITKTMAYDVVSRTSQENCIRLSDGSLRLYPANNWPISHVPKRYMTEELINLSVEMCPASLRGVPSEYLSKAQCLQFVQRDASLYEWVPEMYKEHDAIIDAALSAWPGALAHIPEAKRTKSRCFRAIERDPTIPISLFPEKVRAKYEAIFGISSFNCKPISLETPSTLLKNRSAITESNELISHELETISDSSVQHIYYISDVHIEHQLDLTDKTLPEIESMVADKVSELVNSVQDRGTVLIAGDVANSIELEKIFYKALKAALSRIWNFHVNIISVLGNHELWDGDPMGISKSRPVDEIIEDYRKALYNTLLENELYIEYKRQRSVRIDEKTILEADPNELSEICEKSTLIILGGIGFSGLNPVFNATMGLYRNTITAEEDIERSKRFQTVYEKVLQCAEFQRVIVLTHTQMENWSNAEYNPNWVYINGHTHQNSLIRKDDGTTVLSDNQVGYVPKNWHFNSFTVSGRYDPFYDWEDGIYHIRPNQYIDFNRGCGIVISSFKRGGELYLLKRDGAYMFFLKDKNLYMLEGGQIHRVEHDIDYYFNNLAAYKQCVKAAFTPYRNALKTISKEIRAFGGNGNIHGCIIDIDFFNHIYVNPFDGKITPYFASNTLIKYTYKNIPILLKNSPQPPKLPNGTPLLLQYKKASRSGLLPILTAQEHDENTALTTVSELVLDKTMYEPSRVMRSVQYIFDQNVVRVWKDEILTIDTNDNDPIIANYPQRLINNSQTK